MGVTFEPYEKDLEMNMINIIDNASGILSREQSDAIILACLASTGRKDLVEIAKRYVISTHGEKVAHASLGASSLMSMTNIYYSARMNLKSLATTKPKLKMTFMKQHGVNETDFELYALAVSAVNHCKPCMAGHEKVLLDHGVSHDVVNESIRIASVINSFAHKL
nr:carboxymuconolactone decarboxylase family protein [Vibrio sp. D431a]